AALELAAAAAVRMARDRLLAGTGAAGAVPDPLRRPGTARRPLSLRPWPHRRPDRRALGAHDARGARAVPPGDARALRLRAVPRPRPGAHERDLNRAGERLPRATPAPPHTRRRDGGVARVEMIGAVGSYDRARLVEGQARRAQEDEPLVAGEDAAGLDVVPAGHGEYRERQARSPVAASRSRSATSSPGRPYAFTLAT